MIDVGIVGIFKICGIGWNILGIVYFCINRLLELNEWGL